MSQWGWTPARHVDVWRYGAGWIRPVAAAIPFLTVGLLLVMMQMIGGRLNLPYKCIGRAMPKW